MSSHTLRRIIVWLGYTASFAPLILFRNFYFPFIVPKTVFFRTVVELMFVLWVVLALKYPQYRPRLHSKVTWGFGAFLFFVLISAVAGLDPRMSFWGDFERMWGFLTLAHFFAFFLVLSTTYDTKDWLRLFQVNLAVGSLVALYGIAQRLNFPFVEQPGLDRIIATLGNASYVGAYMILMGASALYLFVVRPVTERWWYALAGLLAATALVLSVTRGAYLGALTGVGLLLAAVTYLAKDGRVRRWLFVLTAGAVVAALLLILFRTGPVIQGNRYLRRLTEFDLSSNTAQTRFIGWRAALNGFYERPLFGWGEENYIVAFNKSFTARFYSLAPTETYFDRAHNQFLDTLVSEGIFGFLSYVSIYIFTILGAVGLWRRSALDSATFLLLVITPVAYAVQDFFVFDTLGPFMLLLILFGFGEHILRKSAAGAVPVSEQDPERKRKSAPSRSVAVTPQHAVVRPKKEAGGRLMTPQSLVVALSLWVLMFWFFNLRVASASNYGAWSIALANPAEAIPLFRKAVSYNIPAVRDVRNTFADYIASRAEGGRAEPAVIKEGLDVALTEQERTLGETPFDVLTGTKTIKLYNIRYALFGDPSDLARARELFEYLRPYAPERLELYFLGAQTYLLLGDMPKAISLLDTARALNERYPDGYWFTGLVLLDTGTNTTTAVANLKEGLRRGFNPGTEQLRRAIGAAAAVSDLHFLRDLYAMYVEKDPKSAQAWSSLAVVLRDLGEHEKARAAADKSAEIDPSYAADRDEFLKTLNIP